MATSQQHTVVRRASKLLDVTYIVPMDANEARTVANSIKANIAAIDEALLELHERNGWKALGYSSWRECVQAEFNLSERKGYRLLNSGRVKKNLLAAGGEVLTNLSKTALVNESVARELSKVPAEFQEEVIKRAVAEYRNDFPSAKQVRAIVLKYYTRSEVGKTRPAPKPTSGGRKLSGGGDERSRCKALLDTASDRLVSEIYEMLMERLGVSSELHR